MIGPLLLLAAQAAPLAAPPAREHNCVRAAGSEIMVCGTPPAQSDEAPPPLPHAGPTLSQGTYRLQRLPPQAYGPAVPSAQSVIGHGVRVGAQTSNQGARRRRSMATVGIPF